MPPAERIVAIGASAGGLAALRRLLGALGEGFGWPLAAVLHVGKGSVDGLVEVLSAMGALPVVEAAAGARPARGTLHLAPGGYHLLLERDGRFALSVDEKVCYARPSIDVLFASVAEACGAAAIGVILSGSNEDGAEGLAAIRARGGLALIQAPADAEEPAMPRAARQRAGADAVLAAEALGARLHQEFHR